MSLEAMLLETQNFINAIGENIDNVALLQSNKNNSAAGCFHIALEHHGAIAYLVKGSFRGSAAALIRPLFESVLRGSWLYEIATEDEAKGFLNDVEPPSAAKIVEALETKPFFKNMGLSYVKNKIWGGLCSYTHSGGLHVTRRISSTEIVQNYSDEEMKEMLELCNLIALIAAYKFCELLNKKDAIEIIGESYHKLPTCS